MQTIQDAKEPATMPHDSSQPRVQSLGSYEGSLTLNELTVLYTTLSKKVEDLQNDLKQTKLTYGAAYTKLILRVKKLEHKGRIIAKIDQNPSISLVHESTAEAELSTVIFEVSTTTENLVYIRRSAEQRKDKGKAIMKEDESVQKKSKKQLEQERLSHEAAIRLQEKKSDLEKALELQKQLDEKEEVVVEADPTQVINWSDPVNKGRNKQVPFQRNEPINIIRPILKEYGLNQIFCTKDYKIEKKVMKRSGFDFQKPPAKRQKVREVSGSIEEQSAGKEKEVSEEELKKLLVIFQIRSVVSTEPQ
ncbi:hypothetical protein Tco_0659311 [Tanacetum coccineum]